MTVEQAYLCEEDVRAVVNLLGKVAIVEGDHRAKKRFLVSGLARIIDADVWVWIQARQSEVETATPIPFLMIDGGWASEEQKVRCFQWHGEPEFGQLINTKFNTIRNQKFTRSRQQIIDDDTWYGSVHYQRDCVPAGLDEFMTSSYPLGYDEVSGQLTLSIVGFYRTLGKPPFSDRDRCIAHLVVFEVDWLHREGAEVPAADHVADLPPRLYQVMLFLLAGDSAKQIAHKLDLSVHTVREYCKSLHQRFDVQSRGELLAKFLAGDAVPQ